MQVMACIFAPCGVRDLRGPAADRTPPFPHIMQLELKLKLTPELELEAEAEA